MEEDRLYQVLVAVAQSAKKRVLTYTEAGATVARAANDPELFEHLDEINRFERRHGRPMLTALVVGKTKRDARPRVLSARQFMGRRHAQPPAVLEGRTETSTSALACKRIVSVVLAPPAVSSEGAVGRVSRAWCTWWAPWRVHCRPVRCPVALSLSATFAHERPARRCSMLALSVSFSSLLRSCGVAEPHRRP